MDRGARTPAGPPGAAARIAGGTAVRPGPHPGAGPTSGVRRRHRRDAGFAPPGACPAD